MPTKALELAAVGPGSSTLCNVGSDNPSSFCKEPAWAALSGGGNTSGLVERAQGGTQIKIHTVVTLATERRINRDADREKNESGEGDR
jgi:hypothetical protein